ncbi:MAG: hypothetical protein GY826_30255 [Fuerstiella sp.]|nr:hypothetical protein [Fuerstiella sp.]
MSASIDNETLTSGTRCLLMQGELQQGSGKRQTQGHSHTRGGVQVHLGLGWESKRLLQRGNLVLMEFLKFFIGQ